jgi:hypothetical protein
MALTQNFLNYFSNFGKSKYDDAAVVDISELMRERLLTQYTPGLDLGASSEKTFKKHLDTYFKAQKTKVVEIAEKHKLTPEQLAALQKKLDEQHATIQADAEAFDAYTKKVPAITHPDDLQTVAHKERDKLLAAIKPLNLEEIIAALSNAVSIEQAPADNPAAEITTLANYDATQTPEEQPDIEAIKTALAESEKETKDTLEKNLNDTLTDMHRIAQQKRDLIGWLAASNRAQARYRNAGPLGSHPKQDYDVRMTPKDKETVDQLATAIQANNAETFKHLELKTPSDTPIAVGNDDKGKLTFNINFPDATNRPGYYTNARHNTKADLLFQAGLVKSTGAKSIVTNITHNDPKLVKQLAREALEAAREVGYPDDKITIKIRGDEQKHEDLIKYTDPKKTNARGEAVQYNVDKSEALIGTQKHAQRDAISQQKIIKDTLDKLKAEGITKEQAAGPAPAAPDNSATVRFD